MTPEPTSDGPDARPDAPSAPRGGPPAAPTPTIAIVGRPNVGKSSLLNRIAGRRVSIVEATAGVTRDRVEVHLEIDGREVHVVDTGGIGIVDEEGLAAHIESQIEQALARADLILFVVDAREGVLPLDQHVARRLRRLKKPVIAVANKCDTGVIERLGLGELCRLGFGEPLPVSAIDGYGRTALVEAIAAELERLFPRGEGAPVAADAAEKPLRIAVVGRRNVGKSTWVNAILGEERVIVSDVPGTTRDSVDVDVTVDGRRLTLIDTAGMRKRAKVADAIEEISQHRTREAVRRCDVALLVLDARAKVGEVDRKIAGYIVELERACVIVGNKWDLCEGEMTVRQYEEYVQKTLPGLAFAPLVCMAGREGENVLGPIKVAADLHRQAGHRVSTGELNRIVADVMTVRRPPRQRGVAPKVFYATQADVHPVTIVLFVNKPALFPDDWRRFLANKLREVFPFSEVPVRLRFRERRGPIDKGREDPGDEGVRDGPSPAASPAGESDGRDPTEASD